MARRRLSLSDLIELCRALHHNLSAGLSLVKVFEQQAKRGPTGVQSVAQEISVELERGQSLEQALKPHREAFPPLFLSMSRVGERSGNLPDTFGELEKYFLLQQRLRRQFLTKISWPLVQFVLAIFVLALVIFILGLFGSKMDPLGFGLTGTSGAIWFLVIVFGTIGLGFGIWKLLSLSLSRRAALETKLLRMPLIGPARESLALNRFCLAMRLTLETNMAVGSAIKMSIQATDNPAFTSRIDKVVAALKKGDDIASSLKQLGLFPRDFLNLVANAEEAGRLTEVMKQQAKVYEEEATRRLSRVSAAASTLVWLIVGGLIIFAIFRLASVYLGVLNQV